MTLTATGNKVVFAHLPQHTTRSELSFLLIVTFKNLCQPCSYNQLCSYNQPWHLSWIILTI